MSKQRAAVNPFYVLLVIVGIAFTITACAYGVMAFKAVRSGAVVTLHERDAARPSQDGASGEALLEFLDQHGIELMAAELLLLGLATLAAMGTDQYWMRRAARAAADAGPPGAGPPSADRSARSPGKLL